MDEEGWVPLTVISVFHRLLALTTDLKVLADSIEGSALLECKDEKIRRKEDWKTWLVTKPPTAAAPVSAETNNNVEQ
jgi:la-related protein 1